MTPLEEGPISRYLSIRAEYERVVARADAARSRYFAKRKKGEATNRSAVSRLESAANYLSADLYSVEGELYEIGLNPERVWVELGPGV